MKLGDKVICVKNYDETRITPGIRFGEVLTIREMDDTPTGTWISFIEHKMNKYAVYPRFLSLCFRSLDELNSEDYLELVSNYRLLEERFNGLKWTLKNLENV